MGAKVDFPIGSDFLNKLLSVTLNRSETDLITSELVMSKTNAKTLDRNCWSSKAVSLPNASCSCYVFAQFSQCASGHSEGVAKLCTGTWVKARGKPFCFANWPWQMFLPWTWIWYNLPETCKCNAKFRSERSNRKNEPTFLGFHFFWEFSSGTNRRNVFHLPPNREEGYDHPNLRTLRHRGRHARHRK